MDHLADGCGPPVVHGPLDENHYLRDLFLYCMISSTSTWRPQRRHWLRSGASSFIHYGDLYSAPSRLLLRSAPDPCTTKKKSFETRV